MILSNLKRILDLRTCLFSTINAENEDTSTTAFGLNNVTRTYFNARICIIITIL